MTGSTQPANAGSRVRRCAAFAPTSLSGLLLALTSLLPFGTYQGCGAKTPTPHVPYVDAANAVRAGEASQAISVGMPYALALGIALGTAAVCPFAGRRAFHGLWALYAGLIALVGGLWLSEAIKSVVASPPPWSQLWQDNGMLLLTVLWLFNVVLATKWESRSAFTAAMSLQVVVVLLIWFGLLVQALALVEPLIGAWAARVCAIALPLGTLLQIYGDPQSGRMSARGPAATPPAAHGTPQFSLSFLLAVTALCGLLLSIGQAWGLQRAVATGYAATFAWLAVHRAKSASSETLAGGKSRWVAGWYALVAACCLCGLALPE